jgi:hypothetical protein
MTKKKKKNEIKIQQLPNYFKNNINYNFNFIKKLDISYY